MGKSKTIRDLPNELVGKIASNTKEIFPPTKAMMNRNEERKKQRRLLNSDLAMKQLSATPAAKQKIQNIVDKVNKNKIDNPIPVPQYYMEAQLYNTIHGKFPNKDIVLTRREIQRMENLQRAVQPYSARIRSAPMPNKIRTTLYPPNTKFKNGSFFE
jgi:hypothetical protein